MSKLGALVVVLSLLALGCSSSEDAITVYSGRSEELVGPLFAEFTEQTGIEVSVRYAGSAELAATLREEGSSSPADVFFAQDPASLGAVAIEGMLEPLPSDIIALVAPSFSDVSARWVGVSGRVRTVVYDSTKISEAELPADVFGFTDPGWDGKLGIAPTNGSFLAFVAAMILGEGEEATKLWLEGIADNSPRTYPSNSSIVAAVADGEVEAGLVNHYYLLRRVEQEGPGGAMNYFFPTANPGGLLMPAGVGILESSEQKDAALEFVRFLLSEETQAFFAGETYEYPLVAGVAADPALPPIEALNPPVLDLSQLATVLDAATDLVALTGLL